MLRLALLAGPVVLAPLTAGCGTEAPGGPPADLRAALVRGLQPAAPTVATMVAEPRTTLTVLSTPWLRGWRVVDAQNDRLPHPRRVALALADRGEALVLSGSPMSFATVTGAGAVDVGSAAVARVVAETFLDVTRDLARWTYRVDRFAAIAFKPRLTSAERQIRNRLAHTYGRALDEQATDPAGDGWAATVWTVTGRDLVEHRLSITRTGAVTDRSTVREHDLPVPESV